VNPKHQLLLKYDWYDPNIRVSKSEIGKAGANLTKAVKILHAWFGVCLSFQPADQADNLL
jgi:hypothetical protein